MSEPTLPLTLRFRPTLAEQIEAARRYQATTRKHLVYRGVSLLALGAAGWTAFTGGPFALALIWLGLAAFTWFDPVPLLVIWLSFRGQGEAQPYQATIDEQGIAFEIGGKRVERGWQRYTRLIEASRVLVLVYGSWAYSVIPRAAVGDAPAQEALAALLRRKVARK